MSWQSCLGLLALGCTVRAAAPPAAVAGPPPPVAAPVVGSSGCVESRELKAFVAALEAHRQRARAGALAAQGWQVAEHPSVFQDEPAELVAGQTLEWNGQRFGMIGKLAVAVPPRVPLVQLGQRLHPLDERPVSHPVAVRVCGVKACPAQRPLALPARHWVAVPLASRLELGAPLALTYEFWWAQVSYDRERICPASDSAVEPSGP
jgi:hypothetical protein